MKILLLEDLSTDAELVKRELKKTVSDFMIEVVETENEFVSSLSNFQPDLIISDYQLPTFNGLEALKITLDKSPFTPFIILTGSMNEDTAVKCMKAGADDYVIKGHIKRLGESIKGAIEKKENEKKRKQMEDDLRNTLDELKRSRLSLRALNHYLQKVREKERMEISREVHDIVGQSLTALKFDLFWMKENTPCLNDQHAEKLIEMDGLINKTIKFAQKISTKLRPELLYDLGIEHALVKLLEEFENRTSIKANLVVENVQTNFNHGYGLNLFRIVQESLTNIARHSNATSLKVIIGQQDDNVSFLITDNGIGITDEQINEPKSLGLLGIKERVYSICSTISIKGTPNLGTKIKILIPKKNIYSKEILTDE